VTAIALALGVSVSWGVGDFLGGLWSRRLPVLAVLAVSEVAGLAAIVVLVAGRQDPAPGREAFLAAVAAGAAGGIGLAALYRGMAVGAMAVVAPISAASAVIPVVVGVIEGERPSGLQTAGIAAVLSGVALVSREPRGDGGTRLAAGVGLALLAALGFGSYFVFIDVASDDSATWAVLVSRATATIGAFAVAFARGDLRLQPADIVAVAPVGLFDVGANALLAVALTKGFVSVVSVVSSLYPVVTIVLARIALRERIGRGQAVGITAALTGVALISAG
jgi:drug/metabolite transporter (DMT)-like permease